MENIYRMIIQYMQPFNYRFSPLIRVHLVSYYGRDQALEMSATQESDELRRMVLSPISVCLSQKKFG